MCSAKELEHFERIRRTFETVDKQKEDPNAAAPQTVAEAMESFSLGASLSPEETPASNADSTFGGGIHGRIKGLKQWPGGIVRRTSGNSTTSSKGKGKGVAGKKAKSAQAGLESDASLDGDEGETTYPTDENEDDYVVRTDHLVNPMEEVE